MLVAQLDRIEGVRDDEDCLHDRRCRSCIGRRCRRRIGLEPQGRGFNVTRYLFGQPRWQLCGWNLLWKQVRHGALRRNRDSQPKRDQDRHGPCDIVWLGYRPQWPLCDEAGQRRLFKRYMLS